MKLLRLIPLCLSLAEKEQAERRQKTKAEEKKNKAAAKQEAAEKAARARQQRTQDLRSAVFAAARSGKAEKVKKGVWEDEVDAAGGEVRAGLENFAKTKPTDPKETLLHIAAYNGDIDLVEWLDTHSALHVHLPLVEILNLLSFQMPKQRDEAQRR